VKALPTDPLAEVELVMTGDAGSIVRVNEALPVPRSLLAPMVTVHVPAAAGVPEIKPVPVLIVNPPGNPVAE
jgi:hypothetical protein